jgi:N-acetyl sugar amidotransferase
MDRTDSVKDTVTYDDRWVCSACQYFERKRKIDWEARESELWKLLDKHRRDDGRHDCIVPGSGGKDSRYTAHILKHYYGMNPLTVTWAPAMYTEIGLKNFRSWIDSGLDNILVSPNGQVHRTLTRLAFKNLGHPFQPFVFGQHSVGARVAIEKDIGLVLYGDWYAEKGTGKVMKMERAKVDPRLYSTLDDDIYFGGVHVNDLRRHGIGEEDLNLYLPMSPGLCDGLDVHYLPYYLNYDPQRSYKYAAERTGFEVNPDGRTPGTYTTFQSLDDRVDDFHHYMWYIKTGRGRCTEDASLDIRNGHMTREKGVALVHMHDGEFPQRHFKDFLDYINMDVNGFWQTVDRFRPDHIWRCRGGEWELRQKVS